MLESEPETKEFIYKSLKHSPEAQAVTRVHSFQKLLYRVFFFCCEYRCELLQIVSELPLMLRVNIISANNTQLNSISSSQTKRKRKKKLLSGTCHLSDYLLQNNLSEDQAETLNNNRESFGQHLNISVVEMKVTLPTSRNRHRSLLYNKHLVISTQHWYG